MKTQLLKLIHHINHPVLHNSESLSRQTKKECCIGWQTRSLYEERSQCQTCETVLVVLCAYSSRKHHGLFPALTEDNIQDFMDTLNLIHHNMLSIGKATFEVEIVSAFNCSGHTTRGQPISCTKHVEELMPTWEGNVLSCVRLTWLNIHSLNTENSVFSQRNTSCGTCCSWSNT
jgi:hypothetical protein